jgi:hypothetical protein
MSKELTIIRLFLRLKPEILRPVTLVTLALRPENFVFKPLVGKTVTRHTEIFIMVFRTFRQLV